jgi:hypothetical protein
MLPDKGPISARTTPFAAFTGTGPREVSGKCRSGGHPCFQVPVSLHLRELGEPGRLLSPNPPNPISNSRPAPKFVDLGERAVTNTLRSSGSISIFHYKLRTAGNSAGPLQQCAVQMAGAAVD